MEPISRRAMLAGTGKTALAGGVGAQLAWLGAPVLPGLTGPGKNRARPQAAAGRRPDWAALARRLRGPLLRPGDRGYRAASTPYNHRYAGIHPEGVALCADTADARTALLWARENRVPFAVRSGGHSYAGYSTSAGLVISLARMNWVRVDRESLTIRLGPGALNRDLYAALAGTGVATPGGRCPSVAVSGLLLGGGFGFSSRHMGLTCDQLLATEVVTACGDVLRVSARSHPDLMWACQGGGGGNFGINTGYLLRAHRVGAVSVYRLEWAWRHAAAALSSMLDLMATAPSRLSCRVGADVSGGGPAAGGTAKRGVSALGLYFGPARELTDLIAPVLAAAPPEARLIEDRSYHQAQALLAKNVPFGEFTSKSRYLDRPLPGDGIDTLIRWVERWPGSSNPAGAGATIFAWGGAIGRVAPRATAFVHRGPAFLMDNETTWTRRDSPRAVSAGLDWVAGIYDALAPYGTDQAYQNFMDPALKDWETAYYGANLDRLIRVKRAYDPDRVFRFPQAIPDK